ncbi:MAG: anti-sigma factor antagonist [Firmicutes bacterium]|nr:anti-sigma factor antagonist [Bacillota bacterium]
MKVKLETARRGSVVIASLCGELDDHEASAVRSLIDKELERTGALRLIFDLAELTFMDSSGLGVILGRYRNLKSCGGEVAIVGVPSNVARLFDISGLRKIMVIYKKREDALFAMKEEA